MKGFIGADVNFDISKVDRIRTDVNFIDKLTHWTNDFMEKHPEASTVIPRITVFNEIVWNVGYADIYLTFRGGEALFIIWRHGQVEDGWVCKWDDKGGMQVYGHDKEGKTALSLDMMTSFTFLFMGMMHYIREYREEAVSERTVRERKEKKPKHGKKVNNRVTYLTRKVYDVQFVEKAEKREWTRHVEAWGVRGHYRTMKKSGKRVFVKPHTRGHGEKSPKEYRP